MNKLIIFALAAFVCSALAGPVPEIHDEASELALWEADDVEVKGLGEEKQIFEEFCLSARDEVKSYLRSSVNTGAARVFNLLVDTASQVSAAIANANSAAAEDGSKMIGEDARQLKTAVSGVANAFVGTTKEQMQQIFKTLLEQLNSEKLKDVADEACMNVGMVLKPSMEKKLAAYKKEVLRSAQGERYAESFAKVRLENLGCVTTGRLSKVAAGCNMFRTLGPSLMEFWGY